LADCCENVGVIIAKVNQKSEDFLPLYSVEGSQNESSWFVGEVRSNHTSCVLVSLHYQPSAQSFTPGYTMCQRLCGATTTKAEQSTAQNLEASTESFAAGNCCSRKRRFPVIF
jgi:hypothetical protein